MATLEAKQQFEEDIENKIKQSKDANNSYKNAKKITK